MYFGIPFNWEDDEAEDFMEGWNELAAARNRSDEQLAKQLADAYDPPYPEPDPERDNAFWAIIYESFNPEARAQLRQEFVDGLYGT